jgi:hypothetical protein
MAIFTKLTFLFIISIIISIIYGMDKPSSSNGCKLIYGKIVDKHTMPNFQIKENKSNVINTFKVTTHKGDEKYLVSLQVEKEKPCTTSEGKEVSCGMKDGKNGKLTFNINEGKVIVILNLKNVPIFIGNKCEIELDKYDSVNHTLKMKFNGVDMTIGKAKEETTIECKA